MNLELTGKSVLVTGSSRGIGRAIAGLLHSQGCRVALNGRNAEHLAAAVAHLDGAVGVVGDVSKMEEAKKVVGDVLSVFGSLDILVCNVGSGHSVTPGNETFDEWQRVFIQNLWSATNTIEAGKIALAKSKGSIVCISSICGLEVIPGAPVTYSVAKAALNAYVRGISRPLSHHGVRINAVAPGNILFDDSTWSHKLAENPKAVEIMLQREVPLGFLGGVDDVANLVAYLVSPRSIFVTGQVWALDGGQTRS
jgi:3-oxoacyl-[acyl-carrier protein] reductase